ncbi:MAG: response regulator transcription factor [Rudanella sp.]|nr:response regulator transcription factor [Rudanella sp.]
MRATILYVEDDVNLGFVTKDNLEMSGFAVTHCLTGNEALDCFEPGRFDLCLLDVMLPQTDGFALARHMRSLDTHVPILFLSALNSKDDRLQGLRLGADDYLTKPFSIEELVLKIEVFLKRSAHNRPQPAPIAPVLPITQSLPVGSYQFDPVNGQLHRSGLTQTLTQREAEVLAYLLARPNTLVRRDDILRAIWGDNDYFMGRSLDVFISRLRKRLADDLTVQIESRHGVGFVLRV